MCPVPSLRPSRLVGLHFWYLLSDDRSLPRLAVCYVWYLLGDVRYVLCHALVLM